LVAAKYPDVFFGCLAYREVSDPPSFELHPRIVPVLCFDFNGCLDPEVWEKRKKLVLAWEKKCANLGFWAYDQGDLFYQLPRLYWTTQQQVLRFLRDHHGAAGFTERAYCTISEGPKIYLYFKLLENPDLDIKETLTDWCNACVGEEAAPYLREYYGFWEDFWRIKAVKTPWWEARHSIYLPLGFFKSYVYGLEPGDLEHCRRLMEKVVELAEKHGTADQRERARMQMKCYEWYEAAARACGAGFFSPDGSLPNAEVAVKLLQHIPQAAAAYEQWHEILKAASWWYANRWILENSDPNLVVNALAATSLFLNDERTRAEIGKLAKNAGLPENLRFLAAIMDRNSMEKHVNMVTDGSFENDELAGWTTAPIHGRLVRANDIAAAGKYALKCEINHHNFTAGKVILNAKPHTGYYLSARIFIPKNQPSLEGRLRFWGNPTYENGVKNCCWPNIPELRLKAGMWNYVSAIVPAHRKTDSVKINFGFANFEKGDVAYVDDVRLYEIPNREHK
jgi:hypothetical protein